MSKVVLITDLHVGCRKGNRSYHNFFAKFYDNVLFPYMDENNIKNLICLGDTFDVRKGIDYWSLQWGREHLFDQLENRQIESHFIVGNHDIFLRNSTEINSVGLLLKDYQHIHTYETPQEVMIDNQSFLFIPWICEYTQEETEKLIQQTSSEVVFGHLEIKGFEAHPGFVCDHGTDKSMFSKFKKVFSGHFHCKSSQGNITYLGNVYQMYWNDYGDTRGFHVFDTETYEIEFVPNPYNLFTKVYYDEDNLVKFDSSLYSDKYVKIIIENRKSQKKFNDYLSKVYDCGVLDVKVIENFDLTVNNTDSIEVQDTLTILSEFIQNLETDRDKNSIFNIVKSLYTEAQELS
jgi:hypothetical protein